MAQVNRSEFFFLSSVFFYHAIEDFKISRSDIDQLKTNVVTKGVKWVNVAPLAARHEDHEWPVGDFAAQIHAKKKIFVRWYWFLAVQLEPPRANICQMTKEFLCIMVNQLHETGKIPSALSSAFIRRRLFFR